MRITTPFGIRRARVARLRPVVLVVAMALLFGACDWTMFRLDPAHTAFNPAENQITTGNVAGLRQLFVAPVAGVVRSSPTVANGTVFISADSSSFTHWAYGANTGTLYAFDAAGVTNCSGTPNTCSPLWSAPGIDGTSTAAVVNGVVYIGTGGGDPVTVGEVRAYDAKGISGCSGSPRTCAPMWTYTTPNWQHGGAPLSSVTIAAGVAYVGGDDGAAYAFDANGRTNCSGTPKICMPLRTYLTGTQSPFMHLFFSTPAVWKNRMYIGSHDYRVYAYDALGAQGCTPSTQPGTGDVCTRLWGAATDNQVTSSPAVASPMIYATSVRGTLYALGADGHPRWTADIGFSYPDPTYDIMNGSPALANGVVYVSSTTGSTYAFDAAGVTGCSGTPKRCTPLWSIARTGRRASPAIAGGLLFTTTSDATGERSLSAFDLATCPASVGPCAPVWSGDLHTTEGGWSSPAIANGVAYVGSEANTGPIHAGDGFLYAFALPR